MHATHARLVADSSAASRACPSRHGVQIIRIGTQIAVAQSNRRMQNYVNNSTVIAKAKQEPSLAAGTL